MTNEIDMPVRQAGKVFFSFLIYRALLFSVPTVYCVFSTTGAVYLKNMTTQHWTEKVSEPGAPPQFCLHEQDRSMIRDSIVDALVHAPNLIQLVLFNFTN